MTEKIEWDNSGPRDAQCPICMGPKSCLVIAFSETELDAPPKGSGRTEKYGQWEEVIDNLVETAGVSLPGFIFLRSFLLRCANCSSVFLENRIYIYENDESMLDEGDTPHKDFFLNNNLIYQHQVPDYFILSNRYKHKKRTYDNYMVNYYTQYFSIKVVDAHDEETLTFLGEFVGRFNSVLHETKDALSTGSLTLATLGARTLLELLCQLCGVDTNKALTKKDFDKFQGMKNLGILSARREKLLRHIYTAGNRAAHDGSKIDRESILRSIIEIEKTAAEAWDAIANDDVLSTFLAKIPKRVKWGSFIPEPSAALNKDGNVIRPNFRDAPDD